MLFRNGWHAKGFGITLTDECDFNLHAFNVNAPKECFSPIYGPDGSGDITKFSNQEHLIVRVLDGTQDGRGVHVALADGGFSVIGHESDQEELSLRLYVSQCYVALATLRQGGIFICKLFDVYTNFSVGLVYLLYCCFEEICIYKPITSRPANSERYFVGKHLKQGPLHTILMYLQKIMHYDQLGSVDIVPRIILNADLYFCEYFRAQNGTIEDIQVESLRCIVDCLNDKALSPSSLSLDRTVHIDALLSAWNLAFNDNDHKTRTTQKHAELIFGQLVAPIDPSVVLERFLPAHKSSEWHTIHDRSSLPFSWYITPVAPDAQCTLFFCFIRGIIFSLQAHKWVYNSQTLLNIPPYTVVLGFVDGHTFVVLDAIVLGGESVLQLRLNERLQKIKLFCESTDRTYNETKDGSFYKTMRPAVFKAVEETPVFKTTGQTHVAIHVNSFSEKCLCKI